MWLSTNDRILNDETLNSYLNNIYPRDLGGYSPHKCEYCFKGEEILEEYKDRAYSTAFCSCPHFNWANDFASKLKKRLKSKEAAERIAQDIRWLPFNHWSIDVLEAFEEYWDYQLLYLVKELNDPLAFGLRDSGRLEEVIRKL